MATDSSPASVHENVASLGDIATQISINRQVDLPISIEHVQFHMDALNLWHSSLPPEMQLSRLRENESDVPPHVRRNLLHLHTMFLGLFTEPHRSLLVDLGHRRLSNKWEGLESPNTVLDFEAQCLSAARQGARITGLLHIDDMVRAHCWISM